MTYPPQGGSQQGQPGGQQYGQQYGPPQPGPYGQPGQGGYGQGGYGQPGQQYGPPGPYGQPGQQYGPPGPTASQGSSTGSRASSQQPYGYGQAPHGGAPYGQPYGPPKKSKTGLVAGLVVLAVAIIAAAIVLPIVLSSKVLDPADTAGQVAEQFQEREGVGIDLRCADDMTVENGATYSCSGTTADGEDVTLTITITDENADPPTFTWSEA